MMPLHRRHVAASSSGAASDASNTDQIEDERDTTTSLHLHIPMDSSGSSLISPKITSSKHLKRYDCAIFLGLVILQILLLTITIYRTTSKVRSPTSSQLIAIVVATFLTSLPIFMSLLVGLGVFDHMSKDLPHQRYIPLAVVATIVGNQLSLYLSSAMAVMGIIIFGLSSRPVKPGHLMESNQQQNQQQQQRLGSLSDPMRAVLAVLLTIGVLLTENFFVWVVSATYPASYQDQSNLPMPLQDNGQLTIRYIIHQILQLSKRDVVKLRNMISVEWILVSGLGLSLVAVVMDGAKMKRSLWSLATRGVLTLAAARFIRTISFLITVLPSQSPRCYFGHFPFPPPIEWSEWILEGFKPQVNGGCNDLIISGHATVTSTLACVVVSMVGKPLFSVALWMFVALDYMVEVYEGFHYSVDMWLGAIMVSFIWRTLAPIENSFASKDSWHVQQFLSLHDTTTADVVRYTFPALVTYIQVVQIIPQHMGNYTIVIYLAGVIFQLIRDGFQQYTQHCLFCLLYMALGVYL
jgi:hypothetical protein